MVSIKDEFHYYLQKIVTLKLSSENKLGKEKLRQLGEDVQKSSSFLRETAGELFNAKNSLIIQSV